MNRLFSDCGGLYVYDVFLGNLFTEPKYAPNLLFRLVDMHNSVCILYRHYCVKDLVFVGLSSLIAQNGHQLYWHVHLRQPGDVEAYVQEIGMMVWVHWRLLLLKGARHQVDTMVQFVCRKNSWYQPIINALCETHYWFPPWVIVINLLRKRFLVKGDISVFQEAPGCHLRSSPEKRWQRLEIEGGWVCYREFETLDQQTLRWSWF